MQRILAIDPGLRIIGYAVVDLAGNALEPKGIDAGKIALDTGLRIEGRLGQLYDDLVSLIEEHHPHHLAVEKLFAHYRHPRPAILMAHARGVVLLCAQQANIPVQDLSATEVKKAITGYGHASKQQIQLAVQSQCRLPELPSPPDVADAIAIAITFARRIALAQIQR